MGADLRKDTISRRLVILSSCIVLKVQLISFMLHFVSLL